MVNQGATKVHSRMTRMSPADRKLYCITGLVILGILVAIALGIALLAASREPVTWP